MNTGSTAKQMIEEWLKSVSSEGRLVASELERIVDIALKDGVMDKAEKTTLINIITALDSSDFDTELWDKVEQLVREFGLDEPQ